jgi:hypothetical protein
MAEYWNNSGKQKTRDWHFVRKSQNMRDFAALKGRGREGRGL